MTVEDYRTPIRPIFILSKVVSAYPVTTSSTLYSLAMIILSFSSVGLIFLDEFLADPVEPTPAKKAKVTTTTTAKPSSGENLTTTTTTISPADGFLTFESNPKLAELIWEWMANIENVEDVIICFIQFLGLQSYRNGDIERLLDGIRRGHERLHKAGLTPKYRNWRGILLVLLSLTHAYLVYYATVRVEKTYFSYKVMKTVTAAVVPRFIGHIYIVQFFCLMQLIQDQVQCLINALDKDDHRYLESMISIQIGLMDSAHNVFNMFVKFVSTCIVHSAIALLLNAYKVTQQSKSFYAILVVFEMLVLIRVIDACGRTKSKVDQFNADLFKLMRSSDHLCDNKKLYLFLTTNQTVSFSAGGFFDISYSTIVSIVAAATTYLVILVQLSKPK